MEEMEREGKKTGCVGKQQVHKKGKKKEVEYEFKSTWPFLYVFDMQAGPCKVLLLTLRMIYYSLKKKRQPLQVCVVGVCDG